MKLETLRSIGRAQRSPRRASLVALGLSFALAGCGTIPPVAGPTASGPQTAWEPPPEAQTAPYEPPQTSVEIPPDLLAAGGTVRLDQVIDIALQNSPVTRQAWMSARAAAFEAAGKRSAYLPTVDLDVDLERTHQSAVGNRFTFQVTSYGPSLGLSYVLFDFGGRHADVAEAEQALYAANWTHDATLQNVVLAVETAYYQYVDAKALHAADQATLEEAQRNLEAAQERHHAGLATVADVLQAKTQVAQAKLELESVEGELAATRGALATAMGLPANLPVDVGPLPEAQPIEQAAEPIEDLLKKALATRPDLRAAQARALADREEIAKKRAEGRPTISLSADTSRVYYPTIKGSDPSNNYSARLLLHVPLFTGFKNTNDVEQAKAEAAASEAALELTAQQVLLDVWTSYYALQTATQQVTTSRDLLESADENLRVANGRYKAGVGSILDLLTAQSALADARAQDVSARTGWFLAAAQLAHDTGFLGPLAGTTPAGGPAPAAQSGKDSDEPSTSD